MAFMVDSGRDGEFTLLEQMTWPSLREAILRIDAVDAVRPGFRYRVREGSCPVLRAGGGTVVWEGPQ